MPPKRWSDTELVTIVRDYRAVSGACTLDDLVRSTGMSKAGVHLRVKQLIKAGRLTRSATSGSIRTTDERMMRQLPDGRLVEMRARGKRSRSGSLP